MCFDSDEACARTLIDHRQQLLRTLERVAGAVEISVLVVPRETAPARAGRPNGREPGAGRRYLEEIRERADAAAQRRLVVNAEADRVSEAVSKIVRAERRRIDDRGIVSLAHLVSRDALEQYRRSIAVFKAGESVRILLTEVRAPYSFAELDEMGTGHDSSSPSHDE
jgi:hypothetical protein